MIVLISDNGGRRGGEHKNTLMLETTGWLFISLSVERILNSNGVRRADRWEQLSEIFFQWVSQRKPTVVLFKGAARAIWNGTLKKKEVKQKKKVYQAHGHTHGF